MLLTVLVLVVVNADCRRSQLPVLVVGCIVTNHTLLPLAGCILSKNKSTSLSAVASASVVTVVVGFRCRLSLSASFVLVVPNPKLRYPVL